MVAVPWALACKVASGPLRWHRAVGIGLIIFASLWTIMRLQNEQSLLVALRNIPIWISVICLAEWVSLVWITASVVGFLYGFPEATFGAAFLLFFRNLLIRILPPALKSAVVGRWFI